MSKNRDVFRAIADPTRREILGLLAENPLPVNSIAGHFDISRPAVSKHVKILTEAGLIEVQQDGRERYCYVQPEPLKEVSDWVSQYEGFWNKRLDKLGDHLKKRHQKWKKGS